MLGLEELTQKTFELSQEPERQTGVVFYLERGANTFCVRGLAADDRQEGLESVERPETRRTLRIREEPPPLSFFATPTRAAAEILIDHLANRRYPLEEDLLGRLSDPNWRMKPSPAGFRVFFQGLGETDSISLGPLGDVSIALKRLRQARPFLTEALNLEEFSITEWGFKVKSPEIRHFRELFVRGRPWEEGVFPRDARGTTLALYFQELALKRRFWRFIEEMLGKTLGFAPPS